jgi:hypothetical protein
MSDAYVYFFKVRSPQGCGYTVSERPATLEAISGVGEAIMESQIVVDDTELDGAGYYVAGNKEGSHIVDDLSGQIWSLEARAASRDIEAMTLDEGTNGKDKYMLSLESRELRSQARQLKNQQSDVFADEDASRVEITPTGLRV